MALHFALDKNLSMTVLESAARTTSQTVEWQGNLSCKGVEVFIDVTAISATPSLVLSINNVDPVSGQERVVLQSAAITGTGTTTLRVYPGIAATANVAASDFIAPFGTIKVTAADADSATYTVGANFIR